MTLPILFTPRKKQGLPRNGLIALYDPYLETYERNILPVGSEDFVTGWSAYNGGTPTVTTSQPDPDGGNNAYRIQFTGGLSVQKYRCAMPTSVSGVFYAYKVVMKVNSGKARMQGGGSAVSAFIDPSSGWTDVTASFTGNGTSSYSLFFNTENISDSLDITVYRPQITLLKFDPYTAPAGLPQFLTDHSSRGNHAQLGSTVGVDTNDPSWTGTGLSFGIDDYCKKRIPLGVTDRTAICVISIPVVPTIQGMIWSCGNETYDSIYNSEGNAVLRSSDMFGGTQRVLNSTTQIPLNTPVFLASIRENNSRIKNFVGLTSVTGNYSGALRDSTIQNFGVYSPGVYCLSHVLKYFALYNRALSDAEYLRTCNYLKRLMGQRGITI